MPTYMYVSLQDDDKVVQYSMDPQTGKLNHEAEYALPGGPSSLAISPDRRTLYVGHRTSGEISSHRIDPATGKLTETGKVTAGTAPTYLSTDRKGKFLLGAYYQGAHVGVHPLGCDGSVGGPP
jgi:6-phosphogluconolactonase